MKLANNINQNRLALMALFLLGSTVGLDVFAHPGGLNAQGCHNNRKTGDYHCHRAQQAPMPLQSQFVAEEPSAKREQQQQVISPEMPRVRTDRSTGPTCYTGPRGGTYTLTASGRKNYGGC